MNQHDHNVSSTQRTKPYIENVQCHTKLSVGNHGDMNHSIELALDPGDFICNPHKVIAQVCNNGFYLLAEACVKVKRDNG